MCVFLYFYPCEVNKLRKTVLSEDSHGVQVEVRIRAKSRTEMICQSVEKQSTTDLTILSTVIQIPLGLNPKILGLELVGQNLMKSPLAFRTCDGHFQYCLTFYRRND